MLTDGDAYTKELEIKIHQTIKKVDNDFEALKFNTAIAAMMSLVNEFYKAGSVTAAEFHTLLLMLSPVAPHLCEELWEISGGKKRIYQQEWPKYDEAKTVEDEIEIAVQINGKVKATVKVALEDEQETARAKVMAEPAVVALLTGKNIVKEIYVKGRIYNIVAK